MTSKYEAYLSRQRARWGEKFSAADLDQRFVRYFNSGERIKVDMGYGDQLTGTIGVTTGWAPCFLLMRTSRATGSSWTLGSRETITAIKVGRQYRAVQL